MVWLWIGFVVMILFFLALDLGVFNRKAHVISIPESVGWSVVWVTLAFGFNGIIYFLYENHVFGIGAEIGHALSGEQASLQFFTGYVLEKSLSIDNIFVIALIFSYFNVPALYQHKVLYWGVLGALIMRAVMILLGASLIKRFDWIIYVFGVILLVTAVKLLIARHDNIEPEKNIFVKIVKRFFLVSDGFHGERFVIRQNRQIVFTPLFIVLLVVESTDLLFAVDSIPAIFAVTQDPFIVFTSNVFAILGLRSLYFALAGVLERFRYLKMSLVFVLAYVGVKMLVSHIFPIPTLASLAIISGILSIGLFASLFASKKDTAPIPSPLPVHELKIPKDAIIRFARRLLVLLLIASALLLGLGVMIIPGPAILVIPAGLAILGTELIWAKKVWEQMTLPSDTMSFSGKLFLNAIKKLFTRSSQSDSSSKSRE